MSMSPEEIPSGSDISGRAGVARPEAAPTPKARPDAAARIAAIGSIQVRWWRGRFMWGSIGANCPRRSYFTRGARRNSFLAGELDRDRPESLSSTPKIFRQILALESEG